MFIVQGPISPVSRTQSHPNHPSSCCESTPHLALGLARCPLSAIRPQQRASKTRRLVRSSLVFPLELHPVLSLAAGVCLCLLLCSQSSTRHLAFSHHSHLFCFILFYFFPRFLLCFISLSYGVPRLYIPGQLPLHPFRLSFLIVALRTWYQRPCLGRLATPGFYPRLRIGLEHFQRRA